MRKDILLSLLAAGAIPTAAFANIDVTQQTGINDAAKWANNGLGSVTANGDLLKGGSIVVDGASAGSLSYSIDVKASELPVGHYVINAEGSNLKLTINGKETNKFELTGKEKTVEVKIEGKANGSFSLTALTLEIDLNFAKLKSYLNNLTVTGKTGKYTINSALEHISAENREAGHNYRTAVEANEKKLTGEIKAMKALIAKLDNENLDTYRNKDLELWTEPSGLEQKLRALLAQIVAHNEEVVKQNTLCANWDANKANKETLLSVLKSEKDVIDKLDLSDEFVKAQTQKALDAFNAFYNKLYNRRVEFDIDEEAISMEGKQAVDAKGKPMFDAKGNPVWVYEPFDTNELHAKAVAVTNAKAQAVKDADAYAAIQGYVDEVTKEYNKHLTEFMELYVGNTSATWTSELTAIKDKAVEALKKIAKAGAEAKKAGAEKTKQTAIADLQAKCTEVMDKVNASEKAYSAQNSTLTAKEKELANLKTEIDRLKNNTELQNVKKGIESGLVTKYNKIKADLEKVRKALDADRDEYALSGTLNVSDITTALTALTNDLNSVKGAVSGWQTNENAIKALETNLANAQSALTKANSALQNTLASAEAGSVDLVKQFEEAYNGCVDAIKFSRTTNNNNLKNNKTADIKLDFAKVGVKEYVGKAAPTADKFTAAVGAYNSLSDALAELKDFVNRGTVLPGSPLGDKKAYTGKWLSADKKSGYEVSIASILTGIKNAAKNKANAIYEAISNVELNPNKVKEAIAADVESFSKALVDGNKDALDARKAAYDKDFTATNASATYGPGLTMDGGLQKTLAQYDFTALEKEISNAKNANWAAPANLIADASQIESPYGEVDNKYGDVQPLSNLIDGNLGTIWHSIYSADDGVALGIHYIQFDLGGEYDAVKMRYASRKGYAGADGRPTKLTIKGSKTPNGDYKDLATIDVQGDNVLREYDAIKTKGYRYLRVFSTASEGGKGWWHAAELNFGAVAATIPASLGVNDEIVAAYNDMTGKINPLVKRCTDNVAAKKAYDASDLVKNVAGLEQWVKDNSNDPAQYNWLNNKKSAYGQILKDKTALDNAINDAYGKNILASDTENAKKSNLSKAIAAFKKAVTDNEDNHNAQLGYAEKAITAVKEAIGAVQNAGYDDNVTFQLEVDGKKVNTDSEGVVAILKDKQKGLQALNKQVSDDYAGLDSKEQNVYGTLVAEVEAIVNAVANDYYRAVKEANRATANAAMKGQGKSLDVAYKEAVALYNSFTAEIEGNDNYNAYIAQLKQNIDADHGHAELQKHYQTMRELDNKVEVILAGALPKMGEMDASKYTILTADDFNEVKGEVADAVQAMADYNSALTNAVDDYASMYIGGQVAETTDFILEQEEILTTAKMPVEKVEDALEEARTHVAIALAYLDTDYDNTPGQDGTIAIPTPGDLGDVYSRDVKKYLVNMPAVLAELALVDINTLNVLQNFWNTEYAAALKTLAGYQTRYDNAAKGALDADLATAKFNLSQATGKITQLDVWAQNWMQGSPAGKVADVFGNGWSESGIDAVTGLPSNVLYPALVPELAAQLDIAKQGAKLAEDAKQKNTNNMKAIATYKAEAKDLKAAIAQMHTTIGSLGLTVAEFAAIPTEAADNAYNEFAVLLVDEEGNDITNAYVMSRQIEYWRDLTKQNIAAAYAEAYDLEKAYVEKLLADIEADFNTKYEAGKLENANELDELIAEQRDRIARLPLYAEVGADGKPVLDENGEVIEHVLKSDETVQTLKDIEDKLFAINLGTITPNADATDVVKGKLADRAHTVETKIDDLARYVAGLEQILDNEILAGWQRTPVAGADYEGMKEELAAIKTAYEADNSVETKSGYYTNLLDALLAKAYTGIDNVAAAQTAAKKEISKRETSNAWADAMDAELATLEEHYNTVLADIAEYKYKYDGAEELKKNIGGALVTDKNGNVTGGGLIAMAKYRVAQAREEFSLNNGNTSWNAKYEAVYDANGNFVKNVLVNAKESVNTELYNLGNIYGTVDNLALYSARTEVSGWKNEAWAEYQTARTAVNSGKHVDQAGLNAELNRINVAYNTIDASFAEVTEYARNLMTAKTVINDAKELAALAKKNAFTPGDLNKDGKVSGADFTRLVDYILTETNPGDAAEFAAADLNEDEEIGVGDAVLEMRKINRMDTAPARRLVRSNVEGSMALVDGNLNLTNGNAVAGMVLNLQGVDANDITLASRAAGMNVMTHRLADGTLRVLVISTDGSMVEAGEGAVLHIGGNAKVISAVISTAAGQEHKMTVEQDVTAIDAIASAVKTAGKKIYNAGGQLMDGLKKGINIIVGNDGSAKKVIK